MKFGIFIPNVFEFGDPTLLVSLGVLAEKAGWDGCFVWDDFGTMETAPAVDCWVVLGGIAAQTERIRLGPLVTPVSRRRPWQVARQVATLDHLSGGRAVLGIGLGGVVASDFAPFGEVTEARQRAQMLDEGMALVEALWSGELVNHQGVHYQVQTELPFLPTPLQKPRIPVWVAGLFPNKPPMRRAARWDGVFPLGRDISSTAQMSLADTAAMIAYVRAHRGDDAPFDFVHRGVSGFVDRAEDARVAGEYAGIGATWWLEHFDPGATDIAIVKERIEMGPPK